MEGRPRFVHALGSNDEHCVHLNYLGQAIHNGLRRGLLIEKAVRARGFVNTSLKSYSRFDYCFGQLYIMGHAIAMGHRCTY